MPQIGDRSPVAVPGQIGDGDGDRGIRALPVAPSAQPLCRHDLLSMLRLLLVLPR
jgi:hypothetical protein